VRGGAGSPLAPDAPAAPSAAAARGARRRERTRRALLEAAREVIGEKGIDAATIGEIAERADVGFGSFYNHFGTKDDLVDALLEDAVVGHREVIDTSNLAFSRPAELLANATYLTVHQAAVDPLWGWIVLRLGTGRLDLVAPLMVGLERDVREGIAAGDFADASPELLMAVVAGSVLAAMGGRLTGTLVAQDEWLFVESVLRQVGLTPHAARSTVRRVQAARTPMTRPLSHHHPSPGEVPPCDS
jgi:AcrR family transcriptional regulator